MSLGVPQVEGAFSNTKQLYEDSVTAARYPTVIHSSEGLIHCNTILSCSFL